MLMFSNPESLLQSWSLPMGLTSVLVSAAAIYFRGWLHLRSAFPKLIPVSRLAAFLGGLLALWVALGSPLGMLHHDVLSAHMVQHLLSMTIAAPLLLFGAPVLPALHGLPPVILRRIINPVLCRPLIHRLGHVLSHPVICLLAPSLALIAWHIPAPFELGMHSARWHAVQQASFFITGIMLWWPVVQPWPSLARCPRWFIPAYLFLATVPCDALSAFLSFYDQVVYPCYRTAPAFFGRPPLADQQFAGALMWVCVTFIYMVPAVVITMQTLSPSGERQALPEIQSEIQPGFTPPENAAGSGVL